MTNTTDRPDGTLPDVERRAEQDVATAKDRLQNDVQMAADRAAADAKALKHEAEQQAGKAAEAAKSFAAEQKDFAANQISGIASAISKVAQELESEQGTTARYARDLASSLDRFGQQVRGKNLDELMGEAERFGRTQPLAFLGAAALAGFMASRFAGASAQRRTQAQNSSTARQGEASTPGVNGLAASSAGNSVYGEAAAPEHGGGNVTG